MKGAAHRHVSTTSALPLLVRVHQQLWWCLCFTNVHGTRPPPLDTTLLDKVGGMGSRASPVQSLAGLILGVITLVNKDIERPIILAKNESAAADGI